MQLLTWLPGYTCRTTVSFGTLKDGSLQSNSLALNNNFSYRKIFQNGVNSLSKMVFKKNLVFLPKSSTFRVVWTIQLCSNFTSMWYKHFSRNVCRDFRLPMSALASVARKSFNGKFAATIGFPIGHFMLPLLMLKLEVLSLSIHYLISIWTTCWWNMNKIVCSEPNKILCVFFFLQKMMNHF